VRIPPAAVPATLTRHPPVDQAAVLDLERLLPYWLSALLLGLLLDFHRQRCRGSPVPSGTVTSLPATDPSRV
jgi:hypothetical protein